MKRLCAIEHCLRYGSRILCKALATNFTNLFINSLFSVLSVQWEVDSKRLCALVSWFRYSNVRNGVV